MFLLQCSVAQQGLVTANKIEADFFNRLICFSERKNLPILTRESSGYSVFSQPEN